MNSEIPPFASLTLDRHESVFVITLQSPPENRLTSSLCQEIIRAFGAIQRILGPGAEGAVVTQGNDAKFWCTGVAHEESDENPFAYTDGFYPMLHTILDFPYPTVALLTGHTFGGGCIFALAHDYRVMNVARGFFSMPPADLGLRLESVGALPRLKLHPRVARRMLLEAHRWTGATALNDGIVDAVAPPGDIFGVAMAMARRWAPKAKMGVYAVLRAELYGDAARMYQRVSHVHGRIAARLPKAKL